MIHSFATPEGRAVPSTDRHDSELCVKPLLLHYLKDLQLLVLNEGDFSFLKTRLGTQNAFCLLYAMPHLAIYHQ